MFQVFRSPLLAKKCTSLQTGAGKDSRPPFGKAKKTNFILHRHSTAFLTLHEVKAKRRVNR